jgi:hypothetical protein
MGMEQLLVFALVAIAAGGGFYALAYPSLSGGNRAQKRQRMISGSRAEARVAAAARAAEASVRPRIRDLVDQARSLASRGFTTAAGLKLRDAGAFARMTDEETQLVNQARLYVASLPRR